ncbi:hypothetical protein GSI_11077 [Ganoderma sinense ZZ0214-1]|uniref:Uncharacterized protein n=1 Tax=Ganoderma sinense ZZ0214-1 TaxID=1077348 RepID=A0A2G8RZ65_9APHY|nr:hypothetical protein GSI_11077 [Ganoderma sinense ZZ0214-1]
MRTHRSRMLNRKDESCPEQWHAPRSWSFTGPGVDTDEQPLIGADTQDGGLKKPKRKKGKARQKLSDLVPFLGQKTDWGNGSVRRLFPSLTADTEGARGAQNPFGDEHAINAIRGGGRDTRAAQDEQMEVDTHDGPFPFPVPVPSTPSSTQAVFFPLLSAALTRTTSTPTTPKRSPHRRSSGSSKSWRSDVSRSSSRRLKNARRSQRLSSSAGRGAQIRSMRKTVQMLGPEAAGAVAMGTDVSPNDLRTVDFEKELKANLKRKV